MLYIVVLLEPVVLLLAMLLVAQVWGMPAHPPPQGRAWAGPPKQWIGQ